MTRATVIAWTLGASLNGALGAAEPLEVSLRAGWDGLIRSGATTEVGVTLRSALDMRVTVKVRTDVGTTVTEMALEPRVAATAWLPYVSVPGQRPARVEVWRDEELVASQDHALERPAPALAVVAAVGLAASSPGPTGADLPGTFLHRVGAASLPRTPQAYDAVSALVLGAGALAGMDPRQLRALEHHLAACGRVVTLGFSPELDAGLRRRAGCEGRFLVALHRADEFVKTLRRVLKTRPSPLPAPGDLTAAVTARPEIDSAVATFLVGYLLLAVMAVLVTQRTWPVLLLPLAATVFALLAWHAGEPRGELVLWSELDSGAQLARYTGRLVAHGSGPGRTDVPLPPATALAALPRGATFRMVDGEDGPALAALEVTTRLGSRHTADLYGTRRVNQSLRLRRSGEDVVVVNPGPTSSPSGLLVGRRPFRVPALAPGARWSPSAHDATPTGGVLEPLISRRQPGSAPLLVVPIPAGTLPAAAGVAVSGWVALSPGSDERGER